MSENSILGVCTTVVLLGLLAAMGYGCRTVEETGRMFRSDCIQRGGSVIGRMNCVNPDGTQVPINQGE